MKKVRQLLTLKGIGTNSAWVFVMAFFGGRAFRNGKEVGALSGLTPTPYASGNTADERGIAKAGHDHIRAMAMEMAWGWLRFQPASALTQWYQQRFGHGSSRLRRRGIVALRASCSWPCGGLSRQESCRTARPSKPLCVSNSRDGLQVRDWAGVGRSRGDRVRGADRS